MEARLLKTGTAEYIPAVWDGANHSGWRPIGDRVLILPDTGAEQTSGKIFLTAGAADRATMAAESGVMIQLGDAAYSWNSDRSRPFAGIKPKPGDRVTFQRYGGQLLLGDDGKTYRVMDDNLIAGIRDDQ